MKPKIISNFKIANCWDDYVNLPVGMLNPLIPRPQNFSALWSAAEAERDQNNLEVSAYLRLKPIQEQIILQAHRTDWPPIENRMSLALGLPLGRARENAIDANDREINQYVDQQLARYDAIPAKVFRKVEMSVAIGPDQPYSHDFSEKLVEPTEDLLSTDKYIQEYETLTEIQFCRGWRNLQRTGRINFSERSITAKHQVLDERLKRENRVDEAIIAHSKQLQSNEQQRLTRQKAHEEKKASVIKAFSMSIAPGAMAPLKDSFERGEYRRVWLLLDQLYSSNTGGVESKNVIIEILMNFQWDGIDLMHHVGQLEELVAQATASGFIIHDEMKMFYLARSLKTSPKSNPDYREIVTCLEFQENSNRSYSETITALQRKYSQLSMQKHAPGAKSNPNIQHVNEVKQRQNVRVNQAKKRKGPVCDHCKQPGHVRANCYQLNKCPKCGKTGHPAKHCKAAEEAESTSPGSSRSSSPLPSEKVGKKTMGTLFKEKMKAAKEN
jgi:ribosomal protein L37AE/L43A